MNHRQKLVQEQFLNDEEKVIRRLKSVYNQSLKDMNAKVSDLDASIEDLRKAYDSISHDEIGDLALEYFGFEKGRTLTPQQAKDSLLSQIRAKVYQRNYQTTLKNQVGDILDKMQDEEFKVVSKYLDECYENGFIGTMYDMQGQGIPLCFPLDQEAMVRAVQLESKISQGLYSRLGEDVDLLKKKITAQVSRGIATGMTTKEIARQLAGHTNIGFNNAVRIARTEGHRIQIQSTMDACYKAQEKGANVVKQWDATLDGATRESHAKVDGEVRELDEKFSNGLMYPGDPSGGASEVVNCRCALFQRSRANMDEDELEELKRRAEYFGLDKSEQFEDFKKKYLKANTLLETQGGVGEKAVPYSQRGIEIPKRVQNYIAKLPSSGSYISDVAGAFKNQDLAILTTETGVEYTSITIGGRSYLIRGSERSTTIPEELEKALIKQKGTLDCHSHPFIGDLIPSESDKNVMQLLTWQKESVIIDPTQCAVKFTVQGTVETFNVAENRNDGYWEFLFGDGDFDA